MAKAHHAAPAAQPPKASPERPEDVPTSWGMSLDAMLVYRDSQARYYWRKQGYFEPLEEYVSAGNEAIAEALVTYDPGRVAGGSFAGYLAYKMGFALADVRRHAAGPWNLPRHAKGTYPALKYLVECFDEPILWNLRSLPAPQEAVTYLQEILEYLDHAPSPKRTLMLWRQAWHEETLPAIASALGCTRDNVTHQLAKARTQLKAWCAWSSSEEVYDAPAE